MQETNAIVAIYVCLLLGVVAALYFNPLTSIGRRMVDASRRTQYKSAFFRIYDKSRPNECNRLIIAEPFGRIILARDGRVYVLGDELSFQCGSGETPAAQLLLTATGAGGAGGATGGKKHTHLRETCLRMTLADLLASYRSVQPVDVEFEPKDVWSTPNRLTTLDLINHLFTRYITINDKDDDNWYRGDGAETEPATDTGDVMRRGPKPPHARDARAAGDDDPWYAHVTDTNLRSLRMMVELARMKREL